VRALDVTDTAQLRHVVAAAFADLGRVDVVVSNAGFGVFGAAEDLTDEQVEAMIATNLTASIQIRSTFYEAATRVPVSPPYRDTPADRSPVPVGQMPGDQAKVVAAMIDAALAPDPPRRLLLGSDAYRLVHDALAVRLAAVEAQEDQAAATDVDGWTAPAQ
jgi:NAD(P)-dependent dehydrogenase (short-subunit alcohol dehydrogenase family)